MLLKSRYQRYVYLNKCVERVWPNRQTAMVSANISLCLHQHCTKAFVMWGLPGSLPLWDSVRVCMWSIWLHSSNWREHQSSFAQGRCWGRVWTSRWGDWPARRAQGQVPKVSSWGKILHFFVDRSISHLAPKVASFRIYWNPLLSTQQSGFLVIGDIYQQVWLGQ